MGWWGTAVGGAVGLVVAGPVGAILGAALGQGLDRGLLGRFFPRRVPAADRDRIQERFFEATFAIMGHLAKSDGRVVAAEVAFAESVMDRMALSPGLRRAAILLFNQGKSSQFDLTASIADLRVVLAGQASLLQLFLEVQLGAAYADGAPNAAERQVLSEIRRGLGISPLAYQSLERLVALQRRIHRRGAGTGRARPQPPPTRESLLQSAYAVLGIAPAASDSEVKRAYRRLMSQHHPDKLASRGLPEEALQMASQKTQEIRRAYEAITQARAA